VPGCRGAARAAGTLGGVPISRRVLDDEEDVLVDLHPHWAFCLGPALLTAVAVAAAIAVFVEFPRAPIAVAWVLAAVIAVPAAWLVGRLIRWHSVSLVVTTTRILYLQGVLRRDLVQLRLQRVTEVQVTQTFFERIVGSGKLVVEVEGDEPMVIDDVRRPRSLQRVVARQLDELTLGGRFAGVVRGQEPATVTSPPAALRTPEGDAALTPPHGTVVGAAEPYDGAAAATAQTAPPAPLAPSDPATAPAPGAPASAAGTSIPDQLIQLDDLRRRGIISEEEFAAKKAELLSRL
jgi:membrane protein YdbS with pleckstrin-like domain